MYQQVYFEDIVILLHKSSSVTIIHMIVMHFCTLFCWKTLVLLAVSGVKLANLLFTPQISQIRPFPPSCEPNNTQYELHNCDTGANFFLKKFGNFFFPRSPPL